MLPGPPCIVIQNIPHIMLKQEKRKGKRKKEWEKAVSHRVDVEFECTQSEYNTTGAPHNAVAI